MKIENLRCEYRFNPLGIDVRQPRLSWQLVSDRRGARQSAYRIVAAPDESALLQAGSILWDSGKVQADNSIHIPYDDPALGSRQRVYWRVRVWDENDRPVAWSDPAWFEIGLLERDDWQAHWIGDSQMSNPNTPLPGPFFRETFSIDGEIQSARLYITSLGIYEPYINGQRVGEDVFAPGWTDYARRVHYQTYDVTALLCPGVNRIGAILGDGWYCGHIAWLGPQIYGERPKLLAQLEIHFSDGSTQIIRTDESWQTAVGPILESDLIMGETYDARLELQNWSLPPTSVEKNLDRWSPASTFSHPPDLALVAQNTPPVRAQEEIAPVAEPAMASGRLRRDWVFDFGQNLVGRVRLKITGKRGTTITLRFGEVLENGRLYTKNLRTARQTDCYTFKGDPAGETYESHFTFHGFRYVQVSGLKEPPSCDLLTAIVLHSDLAPALEFECSDPLVNQLQHNIRWGWKGNSVDIPTDCPQRDERLGWTGDAQVFAKTATYLSDAAGFFSKWIGDLADAQFSYGAIPAVAPVPPDWSKADGGAAWSDAFIIVPWTVWQQYGDTRILETHYEAMCRYLDYLVKNSPGLIRLLPNQKELGPEKEAKYGGYGDWLAQDGSIDRRGLTPRDLIGTAFLAYDACLMAQIAKAIGKPADAARFRQLFEDTRTAFIERFVSPDGLLAGQTQTGYVLALHFGLVPDGLRPTLAATLAEDIEARGMHMSTGFVGTPYICQTLRDTGRLDLAYALLRQKTYPSWLYAVLHGATTIWERWDGWTEERGFQDPSMNSFNHYAYGAVGTWIYENMVGIRTAPEAPGYKHMILEPRPGGGITFARGTYRSPYGLIESHWRIEDEILIWDIAVPCSTSATAHIPADAQSRIFEGDIPIEDSPGVELLCQTPETMVVALQSGSYCFTVKLPS